MEMRGGLFGNLGQREVVLQIRKTVLVVYKGWRKIRYRIFRILVYTLHIYPQIMWGKRRISKIRCPGAEITGKYNFINTEICLATL
jgi:hypothetical protein